MRTNRLLIYVALIAIGVLLIAAIKGCQNTRNQEVEVKGLKEKIQKHKADSIEQVRAKEAYRDSMEFIQGQWDLSKNRELALNEDLGKANDRITKLLNKHVPIKPSLDSSLTLVDNTFINECADCFGELQNGQRLVLKHKAEKDNQEQLLMGKINIKDNRIASLEKFNTQLGESNAGLLSNIKQLQDKWMPRGRLYLSLGALWNFAPYAVGLGGMYQDNRFRQFGAKIYFGSFGKMIETNINMPLSFKRR